MTTDGFSDDLQKFIDRHVDSVAQLETLLLLRRESGRSWTVEQVAKALYIDPQMASAMLADLARGGLLIAAAQDAQSYTYQPTDRDVDRLIDALAAAYQERRVAVISMIYSKPSAPAQAFANAFRLRKET